jgi:hypothetical protein
VDLLEKSKLIKEPPLKVKLNSRSTPLKHFWIFPWTFDVIRHKLCMSMKFNIFLIIITERVLAIVLAVIVVPVVVVALTVVAVVVVVAAVVVVAVVVMSTVTPLNIKGNIPGKSITYKIFFKSKKAEKIINFITLPIMDNKDNDNLLNRSDSQARDVIPPSPR